MLAETLDGERFGQLKIQRFHHNSTHFILFVRKFFGLKVKKGLKFNLLTKRNWSLEIPGRELHNDEIYKAEKIQKSILWSGRVSIPVPLTC